MPNEKFQNLFIKLDGIGDYLFFRLFWPQIMNITKERGFSYSFLCSKSFLPIVEQYDSKYVNKLFTPKDIKLKIKFFLLFPYYFKRLKRSLNAHNLYKNFWEKAYNMQTSRDTEEEKIMKNIYSKQKISVKNINTFSSPADFYKDEIYTQLLSINTEQFVLDYYRNMLEKVFNAPFKTPSLSLPFLKQEVAATLKKRGIKQPYIVFIPFTSTSAKDWPLKNFVLLSQKLALKSPLKIFLLGSCPKEELSSLSFEKNVVNLLNKTTLPEAMQIASAAKYALCSDTSLTHCSIIGGAKTVTLSCGLAKKLFVEYPLSYNVKQTVFYPKKQNDQGIGKMEDISFESVWQYVKEKWLNSK